MDNLIDAAVASDHHESGETEHDTEE
jgi:hypothetical protein